jgi:hypothetical protein
VTIRVGRGLVGLLVAASILAAGCAGSAASQSSDGLTPAPTSSGQTPEPAGTDTPESPIAGVITSIDSTGLTQVHGFTLRTDSGADLTFVIGKLENGDEFPVGHLTEHMAAAAPVLVSFKVEGGKLVVYRLEDAP